MSLILALESTPDIRPWVPICAKCKKPVDRFIMLPDDMSNPAVRHYKVECHGESETAMVVIWAAFELSRAYRRLPEAFVEPAQPNPYGRKLL